MLSRSGVDHVLVGTGSGFFLPLPDRHPHGFLDRGKKKWRQSYLVTVVQANFSVPESGAERCVVRYPGGSTSERAHVGLGGSNGIVTNGRRPAAILAVVGETVVGRHPGRSAILEVFDGPIRTFWELVAQARLVLPWCTTYYPYDFCRRPVCPYFQSSLLTWTPISGIGEAWSLAVVYSPSPRKA